MRYARSSGVRRSLAAGQRRAGYTLMEIMLVVAIIAVIAGGVIIKMSGALDVAKIQRAEQDIANIYSSLKLYEARNNSMPEQGQGLEALVSPPTSGTAPPNWIRLMDSLPIDPWGTPYQYRNPGKKDSSGVDVFSFGPDHKESADDIYRRVQ
ncbi:MAG TPA: type II secretion system major pseudopilin GspG [Chthoniobacterales bacterium]